MKRFEFSLQKLLETRLAQEEAAARRLAEGMRVLQAAREELAARQELLRREARRLENLKGRQTDKHELLRLARYRQALQQRVRQQLHTVRENEALTEELRAHLHQAMLARKSLEQLRERELRHWKTEMRRSEQKDNDEISAQRYLRQVAAGAG